GSKEASASGTTQIGPAGFNSEVSTKVADTKLKAAVEHTTADGVKLGADFKAGEKSASGDAKVGVDMFDGVTFSGSESTEKTNAAVKLYAETPKGKLPDGSEVRARAEANASHGSSQKKSFDLVDGLKDKSSSGFKGDASVKGILSNKEGDDL